MFADGEDSEWLLKCGVSMLARVPKARATKDVDLASSAGDLEEAEEALRRCVAVDLGDHVTFRLTRRRPTGLGDNQPDVATRRLVFICYDAATDRKIGEVSVDIGVGPAPVGRPDTVEPANRLQLARPLVTRPYRLFPLVDQVADKVWAAMATNYPGGKPSSRVKDLIDLVVIARTQQLDRRELQIAIDTKRALIGLEPFERFRVPPGWSREYARLARTTASVGDMVDVRAAESLVARLVGLPWDRQQTTPLSGCPGVAGCHRSIARRAFELLQVIRPRRHPAWFYLGMQRGGTVSSPT